MGGFGQVIQVNQMPNGFLGEVSRLGGGDPMISVRQSNSANAANISFGDAVVLLPDSTGGTVKQFADWQANGGGLLVVTNISSGSANATPTTLAGLALGMFVFGTGIPAGTYITSINPATGVIVLSKNATATNATANLSYVQFAGFAVREVKTQFGYTIVPGQPIIPGTTIGNYVPGQYVGILQRGTITLKNLVGTPVAGGPVYMRAILNGGIPAGIVGGLEANSDTVNNVLLPNVPSIAQAFFKNGVVDANGLVEVVLTTRAAA